MGGLPRRMDMLTEQRISISAPHMLLDAGNLFVDDRSRKKGCSPETVEEILAAYQHMGYDAINVSQDDLVMMGIPFFRERATSLKLSFISANLVEKKTGQLVFSPFIIKSAGEQDVAVLSVMDHPSSLKDEDDLFIVKDPSEVVKKLVNDLKDKVDIYIVLSSLSKKANMKLLEQIPDIDFIISTHPRNDVPVKVGNGYVLSSGSRGKTLGCIHITLNSTNRPLHLQNMDRKSSLDRRLVQMGKKIAILEEKKSDILKKDDPQTVKKFNYEINRLNRQKGQYLQEIAAWGSKSVKNYFRNETIPLLTIRQPPKKADKNFVSLKKTNKPLEAIVQGKGSGSTKQITINRISGESPTKGVFTLKIEKAPNEVRALGFDLVYDPDKMKYLKYEKGSLVQNFDMFDVSKLQTGVLRVGGFEARNDLIVAGKSGELIHLFFEMSEKSEAAALSIVRLRDDVSWWNVEEIGNHTK